MNVAIGERIALKACIIILSGGKNTDPIKDAMFLCYSKVAGAVQL